MALGYAVWQEPQGLDPESVSYPHAIEAGIRGSAAAILVWSAAAARAEWVERKTLYGQRLQKPIVPLYLDDTILPITLVDVSAYPAAPSCAAAVAQLQAHLPPPEADDLLLALLTQQYIRERKKGIAQAVGALGHAERREEMLAILEEIARDDVIESVRQEAQAVLNSARQPTAVPSAPSEARHMVGARCPKGHITYFDRRVICAPGGVISRAQVRRADKDLDEVLVACGTPGCGEQIVLRVDCEGYR